MIHNLINRFTSESNQLTDTSVESATYLQKSGFYESKGDGAANIQKGEYNIEYRDDLVSVLTKDHKKILKLYQKISQQLTSASNGRLDLLPDIKNNIRTLLDLFQKHSVNENVYLYGFLNKHLKTKEPEKANKLKELRTKMRRIVKDIQKEVNKQLPLANAHQARQLLSSWSNTRAILVKRFNMEETELFELYEQYGTTDTPNIAEQ